MYSNFLQPCITEPICMITGQVPSIVDNIFEKNLSSDNLVDKITDYLPNFLFIADFIDQQKKTKIIIRNMKSFCQKIYFKDLGSLD